ncbi:MAG: histidinol dehydrogenase [Deltaproteobacteria bacterium RBG_16_49_23]|nr:MAG: histidinol dehydrogenase [Deltaproteobacteria bacterium RBG_16_49_23]
MRFLRSGEKGFDRYLSEAERRIVEDPPRLEGEVRSILRDVKKNGDEALLRYTQRFDNVRLTLSQIEVKKREVSEARKRIPRDFLGTLEKAAHRIRRFHQLAKKRRMVKWVEEGIRIEQVVKPLERVGIYVPGGKASYPSTVLMAGIPAKVAGVEEIIITTPPPPEGISPAVLVAADLAGVDRIFRIGGVQAIGALAYGTRSIPKVDKIVGPGNRYVAIAKRLVYGAVDLDMVAGPSEIVIISDGKTSPAFVAADLISQAEHDEMALSILITPSEVFARKVEEEVQKQLLTLKREKISRKSLRQRGAILIVRDLDQAIELANRIAPEHLELSVQNPLSLVKSVKHAGAVFLGPYTPGAIGDYMAGPNHILPTAGTARFSSALGVEDFVKRIHRIQFSRKALSRFEGDVRRFTKWEGLEGHYRSVQMRLGR